MFLLDFGTRFTGGVDGDWLLDQIDRLFALGVSLLEHTLFFSLGGLPLVIGWLLVGAVFFTLRFSFINLRGFGHAIAILAGRYDQPGDSGEVSHRQALFTALSATVGLGNIAGVGIALQMGGPGAVVWMSLAGFLGMSAKFLECTLGQKYRTVRPDGTVAGGPMYYLSQGLAERGWQPLGRGLALLFALFCMVGALGGGNMFQANQAFQGLTTLLPSLSEHRSLFGLGLALLVGLVIIGGIRRIGKVAATIVPLMASLYVGAALWVVATHLEQVPEAVHTIFASALQPAAATGGIVGVMVQGLRRGVFSSEAGVGSAAIAHAAARTNEPLREGFVAMLEPLIDTLLICNLTALVCIISGVYQQPLTGVQLTSAAFGSAISWFPLLLAIAVCLFAFSTMISWFYYGERAWEYLLGRRWNLIYKLLYVGAVFVGVVTNLKSVLAFSDMMMFAMAFPNVLGGLLLSRSIAQDLRSYWQRLASSTAVASQLSNTP